MAETNVPRGNAPRPKNKSEKVPKYAEGTALVPAQLSRWNLLTIEVRQKEMGNLTARYYEVLNEWYDSANQCVDQHARFSKNHIYWRRTVIVGTGVVAVANLLAANRGIREFCHGVAPILAAVFAAMLAILANLESFYNAAEKAQGYRESRELFLDAAREFDRRWDAFVRPFTDSAEACVNASELYRQLVVKDSELRAKLKELTKIERARK
jgi:hypothetical protein